MKKRILRILRKVAVYLLLFLMIVSVNFFIIRLIPGDPLLHIVGEEDYAYLSQQRPEVLEQLREDYALDGNLFEQYLHFLGKTLRLDFGYSYSYAMKVTDVIFGHIGWTLLLTIPSILIAAVLGGALGLYCGWKGGKFERVVTDFFFFLHAVPTYCLGILALFYLAYQGGWFPIGGMASAGTEGIARLFDILRHMLLPVSLLVLSRTASDYLVMKNSVSLIRQEDYLLTAKAKGLREGYILRRHLLKNACVPYLSAVFLQFGAAMTGVMTLESIFSIKGMGKLLVDSANNKDYMVLQMSFLLLCVCVMFFHLLSDIITGWIDPRVKGENVA